MVSLAKGLVPPAGTAPTAELSVRFGARRVGCVGGPAHAHEMVQEGAALVAASGDEELAGALAAIFTAAGVVCVQMNGMVGKPHLEPAAQNQ